MNAKADLAKLRAARNRASKAYRERLKEAGKREIRELLDAADIERLDRLAEVHGSRAKALSVLIRGAATAEQRRQLANQLAGANATAAAPVAPQARRSTKASVGGRTPASAESASRPTEPLVQLGPAPVTPGSRLKGGKK